VTTPAQDLARARIAHIADVPLEVWEAMPGALADALKAVADGLDDGEGTQAVDAEKAVEAWRARNEVMRAEIEAAAAAKRLDDARRALEEKTK
jgi:hypothetical protein